MLLIGIELITSRVLGVNKVAVVRLPWIRAVGGGFFHRQGNFPSRGFVELTEAEAKELCPPEVLNRIESETIRLLRHANGWLTRDSGDFENGK